MSGDPNEMSMSLAEMLNSLVQSTILADQQAADDYLELLDEYAFTKDDETGNVKLEMVDIEMTNSEGKRQIVSIPKLSLIPLPVLRVAEATFDFDSEVEINTKVENTKEQMVNRLPILREMIKSTELTDALRKTKRRLNTQGQENGSADMAKRQINTLAQLRVRLGQTTSKTDSTKKAHNTTNLKIHIKLEPVKLPDGMRGMLQASDSSIRVNSIE